MKPTRLFLLVSLLTLLFVSGASAQEKLGNVSFPTSCDRKVQVQFDRAVAMLHSFWFQQGEKAFREVLERDPSCAIANWGIAAILIGNTFAGGATVEDARKAKEAIQRGRLIGAKTERERFYIEAIAEYYDRFSDRSHSARMKSLADAFEVVANRFPKDDEAQIFYAIYLTATQSPTDKTFADTLKAAQILEPQFKKHPDHPGVAHYLIHAYDYPPIAEKGLNAAKRYADIAPSAPHALHMPSHIFTRVGAWQASVATNRRSADVSIAQKEPGGGLHAMDYMVYADLQLARDKDAASVLQDARGLTGINPNHLGSAYALAAIPARIQLERGLWKEAVRLEPRSSKFPHADAITLLDFRVASELFAPLRHLLKETVPKLSRVAVLWDPQASSTQEWKESQLPARELGLQLYSMEVSRTDKFEGAFNEATKAGSGALAVTQNALVNSNQKRIADLATKSRLPAIYNRGDWVASGGLMSYGADQVEPNRRVASMIDKILRGTKPTDLPVEQPTKFEFIINLKAAKQIGLTIPPNVLVRADKVIR